MAKRSDRLHQRSKDQTTVGEESRSQFERDRDRVLHCSALRRLSGVTQVVGAKEGREFHNRLTHTIKVAQVARRLSERIQRKWPRLLDEYGGLDPEVVETAALCHDLGHPPFGHVTEKILNEKLTEKKVIDGFEGNAQSFRIVTKLATRRISHTGLNLTRASLNAMLKYPWRRQSSGPRSKKWGAYGTENNELVFARALSASKPDMKCLEAEIMDWADDIAYSVHDLEDFYRAGLVPLHELSQIKQVRETLYAKMRKRWLEEGRIDHPSDFDPYIAAFEGLANKDLELPIEEPYSGTRLQRARLRDLTSTLVGRYVNHVTLRPFDKTLPALDIPEPLTQEVAMLKELTWQYVILNPSLANQRFGQERIIRDLFDVYSNAVVNRRDRFIFPPRIQEELQEVEPHELDDQTTLRLVADTIASMSDQEVYRTHGKLLGYSPGSALDPIPF